MGFRPMQMLLMGLAGCTGIDVISILRKTHQLVTDYEIHVEATCASNHPMLFTKINVEHVLTGYELQHEAVARAIRLSEERYCSVGAMLDKAATIIHFFALLMPICKKH
jgi:putative redox protein